MSSTTLAVIVFIAILVSLAPAAQSQFGNVNGAIYTDAACSIPFENFTNINYTGVSLSQQSCHVGNWTNSNGFNLSYSYNINCSASANNNNYQYFYQNVYFNSTTCSGGADFLFSHTGPINQCNSFNGSLINATASGITSNFSFALYSQLICAVNNSYLVSSSSSSSGIPLFNVSSSSPVSSSSAVSSSSSSPVSSSSAVSSSSTAPNDASSTQRASVLLVAVMMVLLVAQVMLL